MLPFLAALAPFVPLIGGAISAVGSFMSADAARKAQEDAAKIPQVTRSEIDLVKMRQDAEKAGFNPVAVLRAGGAAGYVTTHHPRLSSVSPVSPFGEGLQSIGGALSAFQWDPYADRRAALEFGVAEAQIRNLNADTKARGMSFGVPSYGGSSRVAAGPWQAARPMDVPLERIGVGGPQESAGAISDIGWSRTPSGWIVVPSEQAKERIEDDAFQQVLWFSRNIVGPQLGLSQPPFPNFLGDRKNYVWNSFSNEWQPRSGTVPNVAGGF